MCQARGRNSGCLARGRNSGCRARGRNSVSVNFLQCSSKVGVIDPARNLSKPLPWNPSHHTVRDQGVRHMIHFGFHPKRIICRIGDYFYDGVLSDSQQVRTIIGSINSWIWRPIPCKLPKLASRMCMEVMPGLVTHLSASADATIPSFRLEVETPDWHGATCFGNGPCLALVALSLQMPGAMPLLLRRS